MAALVDEGKARWIGVSNFDVEQLERCEAIRHVDSVQPPLSLLARGARTTVVEWARTHGTGVLVYSPMASGLLTGAYDRDRVAALDPDAWRHRSPGFQEPLLTRSLELVDGWLPAAELELSPDALAEIDAAIAATGAGSDEPPTPPPHMRAAAETSRA